MKKIFLLILLLTGILYNPIYAQKGKPTGQRDKDGHEMIFNVKGSNDKLMYLVIHYKDKLILKDSVVPTNGKPEQFVFKGDDRYDDGLYSLVSGDKKLYLNFIIDRNQHFTYNLDASGDVEKFTVINSPENEEMLKFQRQTTASQIKANEWGKKMEEFNKTNQKDSADFYKEKLANLNESMMNFIQELIDRHPDYLFSKMQKSYKNIDVPDIKDANGELDRKAQFSYFMTHFWDNFDLGDHRFIYIPSFEPKMQEYFLQVLYHQEPDTICKYVDMTLAKASADTFMYHYMLDWVAYNYETSKIIGHDAVFVHIAKTNHLAGKCYWLAEDVIAKYQKVISRREPLLIGKVAPELLIPDTNQSEDIRDWKSSYHTGKPYTILWFIDPDCPTCKKETIALQAVYDSLQRIGKRNFEVYSIGNDADVNRWVKYVRDNKYPWICVGGNKGNLDYLEYFNIYETGNPTMFILNDKHEIILNKRIDMYSIPQFLDEYEKIEAEKQRKIMQGQGQ